MKENHIKERVLKILSDQLDVDVDKIKLNMDIHKSLGADSLDDVELIMFAEEEFSIELSDETVESWFGERDSVTVECLIEFIETEIRNKNRDVGEGDVKMCDLGKAQKVVERMFKDASTVVSIGTKHQHSVDITILLDGRVEFNPLEHRRDAFDMMLFFDLYVKRLDDGTYEAGVHGEKGCVIHARPTVAMTLAAYNSL